MKAHILLAVGSLTGLPAIAEETPSEVVEDINSQAVSYLADNTLSDAEINRLLSDVDIDGIARFALGKFASRFSQSEFEAYKSAFDQHLKTQLRKHLIQFSGSEFEIQTTNRRGNQTIVETSITRSDGSDAQVNWRLRKSEDGWEVIDVQAMDVWLAIEQRAQISAELGASNGSVKALIRALETSG